MLYTCKKEIEQLPRKKNTKFAKRLIFRQFWHSQQQLLEIPEVQYRNKFRFLSQSVFRSRAILFKKKKRQTQFLTIFHGFKILV